MSAFLPSLPADYCDFPFEAKPTDYSSKYKCEWKPDLFCFFLTNSSIQRLLPWPDRFQFVTYSCQKPIKSAWGSFLTMHPIFLYAVHVYLHRVVLMQLCNVLNNWPSFLALSQQMYHSLYAKYNVHCRQCYF